MGIGEILCYFRRNFDAVVWFIRNFLGSTVRSNSKSKMYCTRIVSAAPSLVRSWNSMRPAAAVIIRSIQTTPVQRDIDSAAKFIGAGAATVGVAGSGAGIGTVLSYGCLFDFVRFINYFSCKFNPLEKSTSPQIFILICKNILIKCPTVNYYCDKRYIVEFFLSFQPESNEIYHVITFTSCI